MNNIPCLQTQRFQLRQFTDSDLDNVYAGLSHPEVIKYYGVSFDTIEATKEQMLWYRELEENKTGTWWAICSKDGATFYGAGGLNDVDKVNKKAEIGFWLLPEYWGMGMMQEVMPVICEYGMNQMGLHRIEGFVDAENEKCKKALAKLNFNFEGRMKDCELKDGKFISLDIYAMINQD